MADYREISQQYAQGGIKACILINSGASVAILSQMQDLMVMGLSKPASISIFLWVIGIFLGSMTWYFGFCSTRHVDRSEDKSIGRPDLEIQFSNKYMMAGLRCMLGSYVLFLVGALVLCGCTYFAEMAP